MNEVFYHVFQRSFFDSNGDQHGDLKGLQSKLDYIQDLGATSILLLPLYQSPFYHNYFANDFRGIDPSYGTFQDYIDLIDEIHARGMKLYMDMEVQYVAEDHIWFKDSLGNPDSKFSELIIYNGPNNTEPESIIFDLTTVHSFDGQVKKVACLDLFNPRTQELLFEEFKFWTDPFEDGSLRSGVDGFRLDHMMDDLDDKGRLTSVYSRFWKPLIQKVKALNPKVKFIGEQADWQAQGELAFHAAEVDYMFAFPLKFAISEQDISRIKWAQMDGVSKTPEGKSQIIVIENHDTSRFASTVNGDPNLLRAGAILNLLLKGIPAIYYGQELGMKGEGGFQSYGISDGNDIPRREAFPWKGEVNSEGNTLWYKGTGPWWDETNLADWDGISVEEQGSEPDSLLNFYKKVIQIRKGNPAFSVGSIEFWDAGHEDVLIFVRSLEEDTFLVAINFGDQEHTLNFEGKECIDTLLCYGDVEGNFTLKENGIKVLEIVTRDKTKD